MSQQYRILIVEDVKTDAELMSRELRLADMDVDARRVETGVDYRRELLEFQPHVILSDFTMPGFDGMEALTIASQAHPDIPFIFVSGTLGEEHAVRALKSGATDYILKHNLLRLPAAVERAIREAGARRARQALERELRASEAKHRQLIEDAADGIFTTDPLGNVLMANSRGCELLGYTKSELIGMNGIKTYLEGETQIHTRRMQAVAAGQTLRFERMVRRKDGSTFPTEVSTKAVDSNTVQVIFHDITERRNQERKIARLSRIHELMSGINAAIIRIRDRQELFQEVCRIAVEHGGFIIGWIGVLNQESGRLVPVAEAGLPLGFDGGGDPSDPSAGLVPAGTSEVALREKRPVFDNDVLRAPAVMTVREAAVQMGAQSVISLPLTVEGEAFGILALYAPERDFFDDEELKLLTDLTGDISFGLAFISKQEKVDFLAYYDTLTGLPNRSLLFDRLSHQLGAANRDRSTVALALIDLDRFRMVNDTLGRRSGDALLMAVGERLKNEIRDEDSVARIGSNRFALAICGISDSSDGSQIIESRHRKCFGRPFSVGNEELHVSATAGIAMFPNDGSDPESLFANAEAALRKAKEQNARLLFYSPEMNARIAESLRMENKLRRAMENDELVLWYQPKVSVRTHELTGFEALMRWQDPETGLVPPNQFIPLMEQTRLILEAGRWALAQVARDCAHWVAAGLKPPRVAVNVSPLQLRQKDFVDTVIQAADETREAGAMLNLEITESLIMEHVESIIPKLQTIRGLGVEISVDDFGTGYSSLAYIARLPIHALKIDRSFVVGMTENRHSLAIVKSVISLAHSLGLSVIAEGVETGEQAELLADLDCDEMQGYLIRRPMPSAAIADFLRQYTDEPGEPHRISHPRRKQI